MIATTPDIKAQLVRVKHTLQAARSYLTKPDPASRVIAVILLDYVAESALKTVYWSHPTTAPKARTHIPFPELLREIGDLSGSPPKLSLQIEIGNLHDQRNSTQHRNVLPSAEDLSKNAAYAEVFIRQLFRDFFGVDFDGLSITTLVANEELRRHLQASERHLKDGRYRQSVEDSAIAVDEATRWATGALGVGATHYQQPISVKFQAQNCGFTGEQADLLKEIAEGINDLARSVQDQLKLVATGMDYEGYRRYKTIAPWLRPYGDDHYQIDHRKDDYDQSEASALFDYALNYILRLESLGPLGPQEEDI